MKMRNRLRFLRETMGAGRLRRAVFWYATAGELLLDLAGALTCRPADARRRLAEVAGMISGMRAGPARGPGEP